MRYNGIDTIIKLAKTLEECSDCPVIRLDIQYNTNTELYSGRCWIGDLDMEIEPHFIYDICEDGTISKVERTVIL